MAQIYLLALATVAPCLCSTLPRSQPSLSGRPSVRVDLHPPQNAGIPLEHFVSYSIEFSSFPDFAAIVRVGGNTQDFSLFDKAQEQALVGIFNTNISSDYPTNITIGPAYFESYQTFPDTKFVHGFNLGLNSSKERQGLVDSVSYACKALGENVLDWET
ncbi:hypothetical protein CLAFUW4_10466 [Fulvia fulva]|uniref:Beta-glucuronidase n=1 Tax=Passalora fulva TaxID=5499 RepID=UPI0028528D5F|nr:Beta-glucuronidase [Fulvia fulva]KAK4616185.1 hypothetical protein CLAFUR4_10470 [Fulvia fulva]KAK4617271.1 hypothetical protein CLAFUR0_10471 [Fulvia fulva]WMI38880.1 Beta-glucuronidase [Fulvia fulva]WPV19063.1 hypothetical protein CLAFUW4_10466 [Fulvia fulva]WPV34176.1 hypothetical protein CLAFUW7_10466 [Fulvia fulva]